MFLERYLNGECHQVWAEMLALGAQIRDEPYYSDAWAVAQETMRRVKFNIEMLVERLQHLGFQFEYPDHVLTPLPPEILEEIEMFEQEVGPLPLSIRAFYQIVGTVCFIGNYPGLAFYNPPKHSFLESAIDSNLLGSMIENMTKALSEALDGEPIEDVSALLQKRLEAEKHRPSANLPFDNMPEVVSDPLVVELPFDYQLTRDHYEEWHEFRVDGEIYALTVAPDLYHKSNFSGGGGYAIEIPNSAADGYVLEMTGETTFVNYLRLCFLWAGFPGLKEYDEYPADLIKQLTDGLLPI